ncbi:protease modulator HflC [Candidatus Nesciobacter abundans]|uniref:protease modulator HflC n=1 Tax=Candidatus Nesciobacter abundans TaxID=2601668 RepID=UPI001653E61E|nr:protease modulator HflC [Candidatus Nesciobacter abundans]
MNKIKSFFTKIILVPFISFLITLCFILFFCTFSLQESNQAIVNSFGKYVKTVQESGLHFILPWQSVETYEKRVLSCDVSELEMTLGDQKRIIIDIFARYYIKDPVRFYESLRTYESASKRLGVIIAGEVRDVLGKYNLKDVISSRRAETISKIKNKLLESVDLLGIGVMEVRVKKIAFPKENNDSVFKRMITERLKEAQEWRGEALRSYKRIKSKADLDSMSIISKAERESASIIGKADSEYIKIVNSAYVVDPEVAKKLMEYNNYRKALSGKKTFLISSKSKYMESLNI